MKTPKTSNTHVVARAALQRSVRATIRLRHSLAADAEVVERLPGILEQFDAAVLAGEAFEFNAGDLLEEPPAKEEKQTKPKASVKQTPSTRETAAGRPRTKQRRA